MRFPTYRYLPMHALWERVLILLARLAPASKRSDLRATVPKILVLKFGGMGEAVLARSLVEALRERNPLIRFDFLVEDRTAEVMTSAAGGEVFKYSPRKHGFAEAVRILLAIRRRRYDAVLDFEQDSLLTAAFVRATSIPVRVGFDPPSTNPRRRMFTHPVELRQGKSMWSAFIEVGRALNPGLPDSLSTSPVPYSKDAERWVAEWWERNSDEKRPGRLVGIHIGVGPSGQYRRWPTERYVDLATALSKIQPDLTIVLTGTTHERPLIAAFRSLYSGTSLDASDIGELQRLAALLQRLDLMICGDTGVMHLAAAMGTPTIGLFGPNTPACWAPVGPRSTFVYATRLQCSPCINSYIRLIPEKCTAQVEGACMRDITVEEVIRAAKTVINGSWLG
jgi:ADP-heptose:LPS heptosyltransferase